MVLYTKKIKLLFCLASFLIFLMFSNLACANVSVEPAEIYIKMKNSYFEGNTTKKITVTNSFPYSISVKAYFKHPEPLELIRQGREPIENLTWLELHPQKVNISSNSSANIYIHLHIPKELQEENLNKHWESWIALSIQSEEKKNINVGYLIRTYIDTPQYLLFPLKSTFLIFIIMGTAIAASIGIIFIKRRYHK